MNIKPRKGRSGSRVMKKIVKIFCILLFYAACSHGAVNSHPRLLLNQNDVAQIITSIQTYPQAREDFERFLHNPSYIETNIPFQTDITTLHRLLNKVMKNSFFYLMTTNAPALPARDGYEGDPQKYMRNIENDLRLLAHPDTIKKIQSLRGLEAPGYAVKSLAIAYDWGHDYLSKSDKQLLDDLENALRLWGAWYTSPNRYYGSVFENHAPWGAKSLAYIAAALGDENLFYGRDTKIQTSALPDNSATIRGDVNISAKGFFDQILHAANFVAYPNGGWHESASYFLVKEIPELLEYAEIVCTYHDDEDYTRSVYASPLFKNAGLFLYHMTTPDGMLQKIADTGPKTGLPSEFYLPGGFTYGDINSLGAGYVAGYFLQRLSSRLTSIGLYDFAEFVDYYADELCFDYAGVNQKAENHINRLYSLLWNNYSDSTQISQKEVLQNPLLTNAIYFDNSGILISKNPDDKNSTIVRFDAQPYFFGNHQHFASGNFTIFKGANLAIDGGRYISPQNQEAQQYNEERYRSPLAHNVLLFGDDFVGQKSFIKQPNRAPYTIEQLDAFQDFGTGPQNISTFLSEHQAEKWQCPWQISGMNLNMTSLYNHVGVKNYSRTLLHLFEPGYSDIILTYDDATLDRENTAHWQMHVRDNGQNKFYGDSAYVVSRHERINPGLVKSGFGDTYAGQLLVKSLSPTLSASLTDFAFPDAICQNCWNGRVWEESTHILRFTSPSQKRHTMLTALLPGRSSAISSDKIALTANSILEIDTQNTFFKTIKFESTNSNEAENSTVYLNLVAAQTGAEKEYQFEFESLDSGWIIFYGVRPGEWNLFIKNTKGEILQSDYRFTSNFYPREESGVVAFQFDKKNEGHDGIFMSLRKL
jgi:hypothetical protein